MLASEATPMDKCAQSVRSLGRLELFPQRRRLLELSCVINLEETEA